MPQSVSAARAWILLALLGGLYLLSFIDRFILALLVTPLKGELGLTDLQLGLLFGTFFAVFYGLAGIPLARLADRSNRKRIIIAGVVVWSACTITSAFAQNFTTLAFLRFGLAIGEAALTPAALSMLTDAFEPRRRVLAGSLYTATGMFGGATAFGVSALVLGVAQDVASYIDLSAWRIALIAVGTPGLFLALVFGLTCREPDREVEVQRVPLAGVVKYLVQHGRLYGGIFAASGTGHLLTFAMLAWSATLLERSYLVSVQEAGTLLSIAHVCSNVGGTLLVPIALREIAQRRPALAGYGPAIAIAFGMPLVIVSLQLPTAISFLAVSATGLFFVSGAINSNLVLLQSIAPSRMRATLTSLFLICISTFALGLGPPLAAAAARLFGESDDIATGITALGIASMFLAVAAFAVAAAPLGRAFSRTLVDKKPE